MGSYRVFNFTDKQIELQIFGGVICLDPTSDIELSNSEIAMFQN
jgi:hypothetical protein